MGREFVPDLVSLLLDADTDVAAAARRALTMLTGEDFGVGKEALSKWQAWWQKNGAR